MLLVTGATGNVGRELVRQLAAAGRPTKALVRRSADVEMLPDGIVGVVGDLNRPETFVDALDDVVAVHLLAGYANLDELLSRAGRAGVARIVVQSSSSAGSDDATNAVARYHIVTEQAVQQSGLSWTFLRPNSLMSNALRWRDQLINGDLVSEAFADVAVSTVDPLDVAAVSIQALLSDAHAGRAYRLSGPVALRPTDRVAILARVLERPLRFEALSDIEARVQMLATMPADYVAAFFRFFADGEVDETTVHPTVQNILGRPPRTFEQWAQAHKEAFG